MQPDEVHFEAPRQLTRSVVFLTGRSHHQSPVVSSSHSLHVPTQAGSIMTGAGRLSFGSCVLSDVC